MCDKTWQRSYLLYICGSSTPTSLGIDIRAFAALALECNHRSMTIVNDGMPCVRLWAFAAYERKRNVSGSTAYHNRGTVQ